MIDTAQRDGVISQANYAKAIDATDKISKSEILMAEALHLKSLKMNTEAQTLRSEGESTLQDIAKSMEAEVPKSDRSSKPNDSK